MTAPTLPDAPPAPGTPPPPSPLDNRDFAWKVISRFDTYIGATNTKAAGVGALVAFVVGTVLTKWTDLIEPVSKWRPIIFVDALLLGGVFVGAVLSLLRSIQAVNPNVSSPQAPGTYHSRVFFGHVAEHGSPEAYLKAVQAQSSESVLEDYAIQAHALAKILKEKFAYLDKALWWLRYFVLVPSAAIVAIWAIARAWGFLNK